MVLPPRDTMKKLLILSLLLTGCAGTNATQDTTNAVVGRIESAEKSLDNLEKNLAPECKTPVIAAEINAQRENYKNLSKEAQNINSVCTAEKNTLTATIQLWRTRAMSLGGLCLLLGALFLYRLIKRR